MGSYGWNKSKFGTVQNVVGDYIFHSYRPQPSDSRNAMAFLNVSKTLDFMRGAIGIRGNFRFQLKNVEMLPLTKGDNEKESFL